MTARMDAIVGYTYRAHLVCPEHVIDDLRTGPDEEFDGWALAAGAHLDTESNLDEIAAAFGIDRYDEASFDSDYFPKVVFRDVVADDDQCATCFIYLHEVEV